jgi:CRP/FNR family transcriptional regulator, cyclic AMP receptor protein
MTISAEFLKNNAYFKGLLDADLEMVKKYFAEKTVDRGAILQMDGEPSTALYFIVSGVVKLFKTSLDGKEQILSIVRPGETFNEVTIFDNGPSTVNAEAMSHLVVYEMDKSSVETIINKYPRVARNIIGILAERIRGLVSLVEDLSFRNVIGRVAKILLKTAESPEPRLTQHEMAAMAGTAREVVGRSLKAMEEDGIVKIDHHRIIIKNREALKELSGAASA